MKFILQFFTFFFFETVKNLIRESFTSCLSQIFNSVSVDMFFTCAGGYDLLGRTKDQIRTTEQVKAALIACQTLKLDGLVIIGGRWSYLHKI